jgi:phosphoglycolate phosphatase-like HAD superfamily hydrolase
MVRLVRNLHADGRYLAVATRYPEQKAGELLGQELLRFFCRVCSAPKGAREKLERVFEFARECGIDDLSRVAFVDDKPENLAAVAGSGVQVIGFRGSGKYDTGEACRKAGIPFADTVEKLRALLHL